METITLKDFEFEERKQELIDKYWETVTPKNYKRKSKKLEEDIIKLENKY